MCKKIEETIGWEEILAAPFVPDESFDSAKFAEEIMKDAVKNGEEK
jgi:hypothetical protein